MASRPRPLSFAASCSLLHDACKQVCWCPGDAASLRELEQHFEAVKGCPFCKQPIIGISRYGRVDKKRALDLTERKAATTNRQQARQLRLTLQKMVQPSGALLCW